MIMTMMIINGIINRMFVIMVVMIMIMKDMIMIIKEIIEILNGI